MKSKTFIPMLSLQLFADGGTAGNGAGDGGTAQGQGVTAAAALPQKGVSGKPTSDVKYGIQPETAAPDAEVQQVAAQPDRKAEFEKMIKGEYKDLYDARVQDTVQRRLRSTKDTVEKYNALTPILELLAPKYGVAPDDIEGLAKAISEDDTFYEQEAMERGMTVKQLKDFKRMERENADLRAQMQEVNRQKNGRKLYSTWMQQAEDTKQFYPSFDIQTEMANPQFVSLLRSNVDVKTAYEVVHKDEIIPAAMQFAAKAVERKLADNIIANGARPTEGAMGSQSAAIVKSDVSKLTKFDIEEVARKVARGERISFG